MKNDVVMAKAGTTNQISDPLFDKFLKKKKMIILQIC